MKTQLLLLSSILKTRLKGVYPDVFIALRIMLNCCDTVVSVERSFSKLKLIKTFNRSYMTDSRLTSLAMLSIEASSSRCLELDVVIKAFVCQCTCSKPSWYYFIMWHCLWYFHGYSYVIFFMCATVPLYNDFVCLLFDNSQPVELLCILGGQSWTATALFIPICNCLVCSSIFR